MSRLSPRVPRASRQAGINYRRLTRLLLGTIGLLGSAAGCADLLGPSGPPIYGVIVGIGAPVPKVIIPGLTLNMWAQANDSNHVVMQVDSWDWSSSNTNVADVDQGGHATVKTVGSTVITATARGRSGSFTLSVVAAQSGYALDPNSSNLLPGQRRAFKVIAGGDFNPTVTKADGKWTSSAPGVAEVDSLGVVTAIAPGSATLTLVRNVGIDVTLKADVTVLSVPSPLRFQQVAAGDNFTCGRTSSDTYCWGKSGFGTTVPLDQCSKYTSYIGGGRSDVVRSTFPCAMEPTRVDSPVLFTDISAQGNTACGVTADGRAYCWGALGGFPMAMSDSLRFANFIGKCGVTTTNEGWCGTPGALKKVPGSALWQRIDVAGSDFQCGVELDGTYACWGTNATGQLGTGDSVSSSVPVPIKGSEHFRAGIVGGVRQACALSVSGVVYCWGNFGPATPTVLPAAEPLVSLSGDAWSGFCGLTSEGSMYCGSFAYLGSKMNLVQPTMRFTSTDANAFHRCALAVDALLYCWGLNDYGELGVGNQDFTQAPTRVVGQ
jgi:hypothetical protein